MNNATFVTKLKKKRNNLSQQLRHAAEEDIQFRETITRKIEMLNCMIQEFGFKPYSDTHYRKHKF